MDKKNKEKEKIINNSEISRENGLNISYNKVDLENFFPNLTSEIDHKKKRFSIDAVRVNKENKQDPIKNYEEDIHNPGTFDFIRRCNSIEDALEVLEYLYKRHEVSEELFDFIKKQLSQEDGLNKLLNKIGGYKEPGYYPKKYYKNI